MLVPLVFPIAAKCPVTTLDPPGPVTGFVNAACFPFNCVWIELVASTYPSVVALTPSTVNPLTLVCVAPSEIEVLPSVKEEFANAAFGIALAATVKLGVLVEVNSETDFVARNEAFRDLVKDIAQQIAAANPTYVKREDVPASIVAAEQEIYKAQVKDKPPQAVEKIVAGKLDKFYSTVCLIEQPFIKNPELIVKDHLTQKIAQLGENIVIRRFVRWQLGEETPTA